MKLLLLIYAGPTPERVTGLLDRYQVEGYTELPGGHGAGRSGRRLGTRAWPGESTVLFTIVAEPEATAVIDGIRAEAARLPEGERLHVATLPVEFVA